MSGKMLQVHNLLVKSFGPQHWWPGDTPFEIIVGAVLTQNTNWQNVVRAIHNLREADLLDPMPFITCRSKNWKSCSVRRAIFA